MAAPDLTSDDYYKVRSWVPPFVFNSVVLHHHGLAMIHTHPSFLPLNLLSPSWLDGTHL
jgi:hypothetical protein